MRTTVVVPATGDVDADIRIGSNVDASIIVVGQVANQASTLSRQRAADGVESVLTRDAIGQFPDQNVAESIRRLPGVNILNDQGEGRFVSVRGLDPELNAASINGTRVPSAAVHDLPLSRHQHHSSGGNRKQHKSSLVTAPSGRRAQRPATAWIRADKQTSHPRDIAVQADFARGACRTRQVSWSSRRRQAETRVRRFGSRPLTF